MSLTIEDITDILSGAHPDQRFAANPAFDGHEQIIFAHDPSINFKAFIAIHNTTRGQALGGCRYSHAYQSDNEAITDVLRLSKGMTYKNSLAKLALGGGKSVIVGDPDHAKPTEEMMKALGRAVDSLGGKYVTAEDMNTGEQHMLTVWSETRHVTGMPLEKVATDKLPDGFDPAALPDANPSPYTADGTYWGIKAAVKHKMGRDDLNGITVAIKGAAGAVGAMLCRLLHEDGAKLIVADLDLNDNTPAHLVKIAENAQQRLAAIAQQYNADIVSADKIIEVDADIFAPCAQGADINDDSIGKLRVKIVAGCANNVLAETRHADMLAERGILYAPDYAINAGGVICAGVQYLWHANPDSYPVPTDAVIRDRVKEIYEVMLEIFSRAEREGINTAVIADTISEEGFQEKKTLSVAA